VEVVATMLGVLFIGLAGLHFYWAGGGRRGITAVIPEMNGASLFTPGIMATLAVALALAGLALVAFVLGFVKGSATPLFPYVVFLGFAAGGALVLRAVGEFRYVGFFKRVKGTAFAIYDTWVFSPLCLLAGGAFIALAASRI
jgi:hypothetical protein